jgi:hypothetical protein
MERSPGRARANLRRALPIHRFALLLFAFCLISCQRTPPATAQADSARATGKLIFQDDFERKGLGDAWRTQSDTWRIIDGRVADHGAKNRGLWLTTALPQDVRVEFDAWSVTPPGGAPYRGDMKCEAFGTTLKHQSGYVFIFGGWENRISVIARRDEHANDRRERSGTRVKADQRYHWTILRQKGQLSWLLDGEPFMSYEDPNPVGGTAFGFNNWISHLRFDNVKVYDLTTVDAAR